MDQGDGRRRVGWQGGGAEPGLARRKRWWGDVLLLVERISQLLDSCVEVRVVGAFVQADPASALGGSNARVGGRKIKFY